MTGQRPDPALAEAIADAENRWGGVAAAVAAAGVAVDGGLTL